MVLIQGKGQGNYTSNIPKDVLKKVTKEKVGAKGYTHEGFSFREN